MVVRSLRVTTETVLITLSPFLCTVFASLVVTLTLTLTLGRVSTFISLIGLDNPPSELLQSHCAAFSRGRQKPGASCGGRGE